MVRSDTSAQQMTNAYSRYRRKHLASFVQWLSVSLATRGERRLKPPPPCRNTGRLLLPRSVRQWANPAYRDSYLFQFL